MAIDKKDMNEILNYILPEIKEYIDQRSMKVGKAINTRIMQEVEKKLVMNKVLNEDKGEDLSEMFDPYLGDQPTKKKSSSPVINNFNNLLKQKQAQGKQVTFEDIKKTVNPNNEDAIDIYEHIDYSAFLDKVDTHKKGGV